MRRYILKQLRRSFMSNTIFCLLLALAGAILCISAGLWYSAQKAISDLNETITTIAIPDIFAIRMAAIEYAHENEPEWANGGLWLDEETDTLEQRWNYGEIERYFIDNIRNTEFSSNVLRKDNRRFFNAFSEDITPIPYRAIGLGAEPNLAANSPQAMASFLVTCEMITSNYSLTYLYDSDDEELDLHLRQARPVIQNMVSATFLIDEIMQLHSSYPTPVYIKVDFYSLQHDGSIPFERGKQYIVTGQYNFNYRSFPIGISSLSIDLPDIPVVERVVGYVQNSDELLELIPGSWGWSNIGDDFFPMEIVEMVYERELIADNRGYSIIVLEGNLEDAKATEQWAQMEETIDIARISLQSFQVLTSDDAMSLLRFNQRRNLFEDGRTFSSMEARTGARVCLVSRLFAEHNELSVGDTLSLEMYAATPETLSVTDTYETGLEVNRNIWVASLYNPDLDVTEPIEYTIIGIFNTLLVDSGDYAISPNTIVIPDRSFEGVAGEPISRFYVPEFIPLLVDGLIVPNGQIDKAMDAINSVLDGYDGMFRFYDQGYRTLRTALTNLRFGMSWILSLAIASWATVMFLFITFYVARKRREAAVLYALGISRIKRFFWVFIQSVVVLLVALGISLAISMPLYETILDNAAVITEEFTLSFRDMRLSDAADAGLRSRMPLDKSTFSLIVVSTSSTLLLLVVSGLFSMKSVLFESLSARRRDD
jgi:hypothetical protein